MGKQNRKAASKIDVIKTVMKDVEEDVGTEEMIHLILQRQFSRNTDKRVNEELTPGQRAADAIARFTGSWTFIIAFVGVIILWVCSNVFFLTHGFDPYPFILLNLVLSCVAAIQAPLIMMSQNRQEEKDRQRAENDYIVNLKSEIIVEDLHKKIDELLENQREILERSETRGVSAPGSKADRK